MSGSLHDQIAARLGVSSTEAEAALRRTTLEIRARLAYRGEAEVARLGRFRMVDGAITFEPTERVERLVNHRYAGMPVVEPAAREPAPGLDARDSIDDEGDDLSRRLQASPERHVSDTPSPPTPRDMPGSEERVGHVGGHYTPPAEVGDTDLEAEGVADEEALDAAAPGDTVTPEEPVEAPVEDAEAGAHEAPDQPGGDEEDDEEAERAELERLLAGVWTPAMRAPDEEHPLGDHDLLEDADFQVVSADDERAADPPTGADVAAAGPQGSSSGIAAESSSAGMPVAPTPVEKQEPPGRRARGDRSTEPRRRSGVLIFVAALVLIAAAGIVYWVVMEPPAFLSAPEPVGQAERAPPEAVAPAPDPAATPEEPVADDPPAPETPLRGAGPVDPQAGGYTFAISEPSEAAARERAERYREQGYRVAVLPATVRGRPVYRVMIGQFSSRAEAEGHRAELPRDAPQDIWILAL